MSEKIFKQIFAKDFSGIDGLSSSLEEDLGAFNRAVNLEFSVGNSLRGRVGCQYTGMGGAITDSVATSSIFHGKPFALFPYNYTRTQDQYDIVYTTPAGAYPTQTGSHSTTVTTADGASIQKVVSINQQLWMLDTMNITATYVSGTYPFTWYTTVSGTTIHFILKANGVSILDVDLGDGINTATSIFTLLNSIDALAGWAVSRTTRGTCPPYGIATNAAAVNLGSCTYGTRRRITCSAHNFQPGDLITFPTTPMQAGFVTDINTAGTNITYAGAAYQPATGDILGYMNQAATAFPITTAATAASGNLTLSFPYWRYISEGDSAQSAQNYGNFFQSSYSYTTTPATKTASSFFAPATSANASGNLYIAASGKPADGTNSVGNNLVKTDATTVVRAGLPAPALSITRTGAGNVIMPVNYKCFFRRVDAQGNITDGPVSNIANTGTAAANGAFSLTVSGFLYSSFFGFQTRGCYKFNTEAPAANNYFYVDDNTGSFMAFLQPGDPLYYIETNTAQTTGVAQDAGFVSPVGLLHKTRVTDYCPLVAVMSPLNSSIKVTDSDGVVSILNNSPISTGLTVVFLRTAVNGNQYYVLAEVPYVGYASLTIYDNALDSALILKEQFIEPVLGKEHNNPPQCSLVTQHQGGLVVARGLTAPNTVAFSTVDGIEYFPTASNSFDVPSTVSGAITAIASDTADRLAVFKERAYYDIAGDLDGGAFSVNVVNEGDYGITSQASLKRVKNQLIGLSKNGFVTIHDGFLDTQTFAGLNARLLNQNYYFNWAVAENDGFNRNYVCSVPTTGEPVTYLIDYSRAELHTFERSYTTKIDPATGFAASGNDFFHCSITSPYSIYRRLPRFNGNSPSGNNDGDSFIDNTNAISYILETNPINFEEPGQLKTPIRLRLWSIPNDYVIEGFVSFATLVETGASAVASLVGAGNNNATSSSVIFATATQLFKDVKLVNCKCHFYIVRLTTNTIRTAPFWTGYEIMFAADYKKEDFVK